VHIPAMIVCCYLSLGAEPASRRAASSGWMPLAKPPRRLLPEALTEACAQPHCPTPRPPRMSCPRATLTRRPEAPLGPHAHGRTERTLQRNASALHRKPAGAKPGPSCGRPARSPAWGRRSKVARRLRRNGSAHGHTQPEDAHRPPNARPMPQGALRKAALCRGSVVLLLAWLSPGHRT